MAVVGSHPTDPPPPGADRGNAPAPSRPARGFVHLKTRADFLRVAKGSRFHTTAFSLQAGPGGASRDPAAGLPARFGLTVTKKTAAGAVQRNRIRRRLREVVRAAMLAAEPGYDYVLVARREALVIPFTQLTEDLVRALRGVHARRGARRGSSTATGVRPSDLAAIGSAPSPDDDPTYADFGKADFGKADFGKDQ